jgi:hypothetical protein
MGRKVPPMKDKEFVVDLVATLMQGLAPPRSARDPTRRMLSRFMIRQGRSMA